MRPSIYAYVHKYYTQGNQQHFGIVHPIMHLSAVSLLQTDT